MHTCIHIYIHVMCECERKTLPNYVCCGRVNRSYFTNVYLHSTPSKPVHMDLPTNAPIHITTLSNGDSHTHAHTQTHTSIDRHDVKDVYDPLSPFPVALHPNLITLSNLPKSKWQQLAYLDLIRVRAGV